MGVLSPLIDSPQPVKDIMAESQSIQQRRSRAVKTAWVLAIVAGMIFVAFILSGVLGNMS